MPLNSELHEFLHIGAAYPLYFYFIKQCVVLLGINIILSSIPELIINTTQGKMCRDLDGLVYNFYSSICKSSVINIMDVKEIDMLEVQSILNFIIILVSIIFIAIMDLDMKRKYAEYADEYILPNAADYSIMIKGLPPNVTLS